MILQTKHCQIHHLRKLKGIPQTGCKVQECLFNVCKLHKHYQYHVNFMFNIFLVNK